MEEYNPNTVLYDQIRHIRFPEFAGFMGQNELGAFSVWSSEDSPELGTASDFMIAQFKPLIVHLSHCLNTIEYAVSTELEETKLFPSIARYLACILFHFIPSNYYGHLDFDESAVNKINAALVLWQSGLVPVFDGLTWRLHNTTGVVSAGLQSSSGNDG